MQAHEELSTAASFFDSYHEDGDAVRRHTDMKAWLDDDNDAFDDEGTTVVIGRAQFFMGAMRDFVV